MAAAVGTEEPADGTGAVDTLDWAGLDRRTRKAALAPAVRILEMRRAYAHHMLCRIRHCRERDVHLDKFSYSNTSFHRLMRDRFHLRLTSLFSFLIY
jgi:hypothetical protein